MCAEYLCVVPPKVTLVGLMLKLRWLKENMFPLPKEPTQQQLAVHCKAYILGLIGGSLCQKS